MTGAFIIEVFARVIDHIVATLEVVLMMLMTVLLRVQPIVAIGTELPRECPLHVGRRRVAIVAVVRHVKDLVLEIWRDLVQVVGGGEMVLVRAARHPGLMFTVNATGWWENLEVGARVPATAVTRGALQLDLELVGGRRLPVLLVHAVGRRGVLRSRMAARLMLREWVRWLAMLGIVMACRLVHHR